MSINKIRLFEFCIGLVLFLTSDFAYSQNECGDITLNKARKDYEIGNFQEVIKSLDLCLRDGFNTRQKVEAYRLLAISNLAIDSLDATREASARLLEINPTFEPTLFDPPGFIQIVNSIKNIGVEQLVTSVSKKAENVLKAPATVLIITDEEIKNRGFQDVEQVFHDLPGFDITKGRGANYSNLYQRGYRSILTDRTILLIDGAEQNDLSSDNAPISRQYPLSNIKRIEVIYGPASTMYGANAFVGVVNIVTKNNLEILKNNKSLGVDVNTNYSSMNTKYLDATIVGKNKDFSFSLTGRFFKSDEMDLSSYDDWNFKLGNIDYAKKMNISGKDNNGNYLANNYLVSSKLDSYPSKGLYAITYDSKNMATNIALTESGAKRAYDLDNKALNPEPGQNPLIPDASSRDWYLKGKIQMKNYTFAIESWKTDEGMAPWYNDHVYLFRKNFTRWINWNSNFYLNYEKSISEKLFFTNLVSYRVHAVNGDTNFETYNGYCIGAYSFLELVTSKDPQLTTTYYYRTSNQIKNEMRLLWSPVSNLDIMSGIEFKSSLIQGDYLKSTIPFPDENGSIKAQGILGTDHFRAYDLGIYSQATYSFNRNLNLVFGGRLDNNRIRQHGGYGTVFNPRIAFIYSPGSFILKAIYATAFKDASYLQKYATIPSVRDLPNPTLKPEKVKNFEFSAFWKNSKGLSLDVAAFNSYYSDVVGTAVVTLENGSSTGQFQPIGEQQIYGLQSNAKYVAGKYTFWANYTYTDPVDKKLDIRISDIASHHLNFGADVLYFKHLNINVRSNYTGRRLTGLGTSGSKNPNTFINPYQIFHVMVGYNDLIKDLTVQFGAYNVLNTKYNDPGVREATDPYNSMIPQYGRLLMIKLLYHIE